jgi:hypothetical protein
MTKLDDLATVIDLACLTEDRDPGEQRALLALALDADMDRGAFLSSNADPRPPTLVTHVEASYNPPDGGRMASLTKAQREKYGRLVERWAMCTRCGWPQGIHHADNACPPDESYYARRLTEWRAAHVERIAR